MSGDPKLERLIRVLETRGRRGFLFLRSAEGGLIRGSSARPAASPVTAEANNERTAGDE